MTPTTFGEMLAALKTGEPVPVPDREDWKGMIERTTAPGRVSQVDDETYDYFLDVLPPRWMGRAGFAFGEGADHLRLYWRGPQQTFFCRQMTPEESALFCRLAGIPLTSG